MSKIFLTALLGLAIAAGLGAAAPGALDSFVLPGDADYQKLSGLEKKFGAARLPQAGTSRGELVMALAELSTDSVLRPAPAGVGSDDYDALYALLQKYRDELRKMGFDQKALEDQLASLKVRAAELQDRLDKLHPKDGMKIHGRATAFWDDLILSGPGYNNGTPIRYRHGITRGELEFTFTRGRFSGIMEMNVQRVTDLFVCIGCSVGLRRLYVEARTPIAFQAGEMPLQMTPLTMWRAEDENPFEQEPFVSRRARLRHDLRLERNAWFVQGLKVSTDATLFGRQKMELEGFISSLGLPGQVRFTRSTVEPLHGDPLAGTSAASVYNTYFGIWRARLPFDFGLAAGYTGSIIRDASDSATAVYASGLFVPAFDSQVHAADLHYRSESGMVSIGGEYAASLFSAPNLNPYFASDYITGTAMTAYGALDLGAFKVTISARSVDNSFVSAPAQGRSQLNALSPLGPFPTENNQFNAALGTYGNTGAPAAPETRYNGVFLAPQVATATGPYTFGPVFAHLLPFDPRLNALDPYGPATPNRSGFRAETALELWDGILGLKGDMDMTAEVVKGWTAKPVSFLLYRGGTKLNFKPWFGWPVRLAGGYELRDTRNSDFVAFSSTLVDLGLHWDVAENLTFSMAARHLDYNGTLPYAGGDPGLNLFGKVAIRQAVDIGALGLKVMLSDDMFVRLSYSSQYFEDFLAKQTSTPKHFQSDQAFLETSIQF